ncbi:MAG: ATP-binding protein [Syntrophotaleaceae bacterium]
MRDKIFDSFFTTKDNGTGLGLATVHAIVEAHRGRLELVKAEGGGERFVISMPDAAADILEQAV